MSRCWSKQEDEYLINTYPYKGLAYCVNTMDRSRDSIKQRARILGIHVLERASSMRDTAYDDKIRVLGFLRLEPYVNNRTAILHRCSEGHEWQATPSNLSRGISGCPSCAKYGFDPNLPATLYFVSLPNGTYKIGITKHKNPLNRFPARDRKLITLEWCVHFEQGSKARQLEQELLKIYGKNQANEDLLVNGNTECVFDFIPKPEVLC